MCLQAQTYQSQTCPFTLQDEQAELCTILTFKREPLMFSTIPRCFILFTMFCKPYFTNPWQMYYKNCFIGNVNNVFLIKKSKILYQSIVISFGNHPFFQLLISRLQAFYNCRSINTCLF